MHIYIYIYIFIFIYILRLRVAGKLFLRVSVGTWHELRHELSTLARHEHRWTLLFSLSFSFESRVFI